MTQRDAAKKFKDLWFRVFFNLSFYLDRLQQGSHLYQRAVIQRDATAVWGAVVPNCTLLINHWHNSLLVR